jgi:hypothetical protein
MNYPIDPTIPQPAYVTRMRGVEQCLQVPPKVILSGLTPIRHRARPRAGSAPTRKAARAKADDDPDSDRAGARKGAGHV